MGSKYIHIHDDFAHFDSIIIDFFLVNLILLNTNLEISERKWYYIYIYIFGNQGHVRLIISIYRMVASASQQNYQLTIELYLLKEKILQFSQAFDQGYTLKHLYCAKNTYTVYEFTYI